MKKVYYLLIALSLALSMESCQKQQIQSKSLSAEKVYHSDVTSNYTFNVAYEMQNASGDVIEEGLSLYSPGTSSFDISISDECYMFYVEYDYENQIGDEPDIDYQVQDTSGILDSGSESPNEEFNYQIFF